MLDKEQKRQFYRDGYIVIKKAVAPELIESALGRIRSANKGENLGAEPVMTDLLNKSSLTPILTDMIGDFDPPIACQVGVIKPRKAGDHFNNIGYRDKDMPYYGAETHMDGSITIAQPQEVQEAPSGNLPTLFCFRAQGRSRKKRRRDRAQHGPDV